MARIELGKTYRCTVTGFVGVATGRTEFLGGNERAMLQARAMPDGVPTKPVWIEAPQLVEAAGPALTPTKQAAAAQPKRPLPPTLGHRMALGRSGAINPSRAKAPGVPAPGADAQP